MRSYSAKASASLGALNAIAYAPGGSGAVPTGDPSDEYQVQITGTFVGTVLFQGSLDGSGWYNLRAEDAGTGAIVQSTTAVGAWVIRNPPPYVRFVMNPYTSGAALLVATGVTVK